MRAPCSHLRNHMLGNVFGRVKIGVANTQNYDVFTVLQPCLRIVMHFPDVPSRLREPPGHARETRFVRWAYVSHTIDHSAV